MWKVNSVFHETDLINMFMFQIFMWSHILNALFSEPTMISISLVEASKNSEDGEDDIVFLFFTESAVEEHHDNIQVSRIARVCKVCL